MVIGSGAKLRPDKQGQGGNPAIGVKYVSVQFDKVVPFSNVGGAVEFASVVLAGLPVANLQMLGGLLHIEAFESTAQANIIDTFAITYSLGSAPTVDNTLATTEIDLLTAKTLAAATGGVSPHGKNTLDGLSTVAGAISTAPGYIDNTAGDKEVNLNMTLPDNNVSGVGSLRVRGSLRFAYVAYA